MFSNNHPQTLNLMALLTDSERDYLAGLDEDGMLKDFAVSSRQCLTLALRRAAQWEQIHGRELRKPSEKESSLLMEVHECLSAA